ncbi:MAG: trypsin-like peptidase domain-containing protein [Pseudomonadota bacterium]
MKLQRLLQYVGWPIAAGIIIALLSLLLFPQLRAQHNSAATTYNGYGPVSYADAVSRAAPAVVNIYTEKKVLQRAPSYYNNPYYRRFYNNSNTPLQERMQKTLGSGVIVDNRGLILTNNHVINGADKIQVLLYDGRVTSAELVGNDVENDIAVLKIQLDKLTAINIDEPGNIRVGDVVLAIGNPFGVGQSVSQGIVSATGRWNLGINELENFIQTDAAINPGNSGGALVDARGNLIGINTAQLDETTAASVGISFAVPAEIAMKSLKQIIEFGEVRRIWLGISAEQLSARGVEVYGMEGMIVTAIEAGAPADQAGLKPKDIITHINDLAVSDGHRVKNLIADIELGSEIKIRILREGKTMELKAIAKIQPNAHTQT